MQLKSSNITNIHLHNSIQTIVHSSNQIDQFDLTLVGTRKFSKTVLCFKILRKC